jgi:glycosyltransferase involved in cell wall biosynthesis
VALRSPPIDGAAGTSLAETTSSSKGALMEPSTSNDIVCLSHLRWNFVYQRPQHLMTRYGRTRRVFFVEEPVTTQEGPPRYDVKEVAPGVRTLTPLLPPGTDWLVAQRDLLDHMLFDFEIEQPVLWYYTPMALPFSEHVDATLVAYDCMDELSAFRGAPPRMLALESRLLDRADVVFTGGSSLYQAKRHRHPNVYEVPSSVDVAHFGRAREPLTEPEDQRSLRRPRLGFFGVIDERMDLELLAGVADRRPDWEIVLLGPVVKVDPASLPRRENVHYLGLKSYDTLPHYLAHWDVAIMPFARNDATRFISPTKTPEYLAAGLPVVSTAIADVVRPYGEAGLVRIAIGPGQFVRAAEAAMSDERGVWLAQVDRHLAGMSWDRTWARTEAALASWIAEKTSRLSSAEEADRLSPPPEAAAVAS